MDQIIINIFVIWALTCAQRSRNPHLRLCIRQPTTQSDASCSSIMTAPTHLTRHCSRLNGWALYRRNPICDLTLTSQDTETRSSPIVPDLARVGLLHTPAFRSAFSRRCHACGPYLDLLVASTACEPPAVWGVCQGKDITPVPAEHNARRTVRQLVDLLLTIYDNPEVDTAFRVACRERPGVGGKCETAHLFMHPCVEISLVRTQIEEVLRSRRT